MEDAQAELAAQAADAIVGFLHRLHREDQGRPPIVRLEYGDNKDFNSYLDDENEHVRICDLTYQPSEVLFAVDQEAYRDLLAGYEAEEADTGEPAVDLEQEPERERE